MRFLRSLPKSFVNKNSLGGRFFLFNGLSSIIMNNNVYLNLFVVSKIFTPFYFSSNFFGFNCFRSTFIYCLMGFPFIKYSSATTFSLNTVFSFEFIFPLLKTFVRRLHFSCGTYLSLVLSERFLFLKKLNNYKSVRNNLGLSVRGQRTHTNCSTQKKRVFLNSKKRRIVDL